jgi:hypothetical protein
MKKALALTGLLLTAALTGAFAQSTSSVGSWRFDAAQSDMGTQPKPKSIHLFITTDSPAMLAWHLTETRADGKVIRESWSGPEDGTMQTLKNSEGNGHASFSRSGADLVIEEKMSDGATMESHVTISDGGNTMTEHVTGTDKDGKPITSTIVWHRVTAKKKAAAS